MKVVILAGGYGTRLSEETELKPKPMVEIGGRPILWHIMKIYSHYGHNDFVICLGYKGYIIKEYFANYLIHQSDLSIDLKKNRVKVMNSKAEPWKITLVDTGLNTMTGGRIKAVRPYIGNRTFMMTYGDGVGNINIKELLAFHRKQRAYATVTAVTPPGRFGALGIDRQGSVVSFREKPAGDGSCINGGFFVLEPEVFDYIEGRETFWEKEPLEELSRDRKLAAYIHRGFWRPVDTLRDKRELEGLWDAGKADWKVWSE